MSQSTNHLVLPTPAQVEWMERETGVIIHLDLQVFEPSYSFREQWGYTPEASVFNPTSLDTDQWIATAKATGATYAVLVAKHCSGFCLWPTEAHDYSVRSSPWRDGQGDVVADFIASCRKYGVKPGLYYSVSLNARFDVEVPGRVCSGDPEKQAAYHRIVEQQLTELWSNYGEIFYIWFDGGVISPEEGGPELASLLKRLQPQAVVYQGPDDWLSQTRFVGNERAEAPNPFWNTIDRVVADTGTSESTDRGGHPDGQRWICGESDMPNRCQKRAFQGGWFWREGDEPFLYSIDHLVNCYFTSIGRNTNLLLGMVIDPRGLVPEADVEQFSAFRKRIEAIFSNRLAETTGRGSTLSLALPAGSRPNLLMLREEIAKGERVRRFLVEGRIAGEWVELWQGTCIGRKRLERFAPLDATELRLTVLESAAEPQIWEFSAWAVEEGLIPGPLDMTQRCKIAIWRDREGWVHLSCSDPSLEIRYTVNGSEPDASSPTYDAPLPLPNGGVVKAYASINELSRSATTTAKFGVDRSMWKVIHQSIESPFTNAGEAGVEHLLSDDNGTYWHTYHSDKKLSAPPHEVVFDMGHELIVSEFTFLPRDTGSSDGTPDAVAFYLSNDGKEWRLAADAVFEDICEKKEMRLIPANEPMRGRFLRFVVKRVVDEGDFAAVAGVGVVEGAGATSEDSE